MNGFACEFLFVRVYEPGRRCKWTRRKRNGHVKSATKLDKAKHIKSLVKTSHHAARCAQITLPSLIAVVRQIKKQSLHIEADAQHGKITRSSLS
jgi:hypothetical protein